MFTQEFQTDSSLITTYERRLVVRTLSVQPDPFYGLKGHAYIKARNLAPAVQRVQTSAHDGPAPSTKERK